MVKNLPANARDMGLIPGPGRSLMQREQLSSCATATEPTDCRVRAPQQKKPPQ